MFTMRSWRKIQIWGFSWMLLRATENAVAGHIWPAGRYLPTPDLWSRLNTICFVRYAYFRTWCAHVRKTKTRKTKHAVSNKHGTWDSWRYGPGDNRQRFRVQKIRRHETFCNWLFFEKHTERDQGYFNKFVSKYSLQSNDFAITV